MLKNSIQRTFHGVMKKDLKKAYKAGVLSCMTGMAIIKFVFVLLFFLYLHLNLYLFVNNGIPRSNEKGFEESKRGRGFILHEKNGNYVIAKLQGTTQRTYLNSKEYLMICNTMKGQRLS